MKKKAATVKFILAVKNNLSRCASSLCPSRFHSVSLTSLSNMGVAESVRIHMKSRARTPSSDADNDERKYVTCDERVINQ